MRCRTARWLGALAATAGLIGGCATDGRELRDPGAGAVSPPPVADQPEAGSEPQESRADFSFEAPAFADGGPIPAAHTCDGAGTSPELRWAGVPFGAAELVVVVTDPEAEFFTHWVITGLSPESTGLDSGEVPEGAVEAINGFGDLGWGGPCPTANHRFLFTLHVLPEPLGMVDDLDGPIAIGLVELSTIQAISFTGTYGPAGS